MKGVVTDNLLFELYSEVIPLYSRVEVNDLCLMIHPIVDIVFCEFGELEDSPWFFDAIQDFLRDGESPDGYDGFSYMLGDLKNEHGCVYEWTGELKNYTFNGERRLLYDPKIPAGENSQVEMKDKF